mgnify:CR=1 FL=1
MKGWRRVMPVVWWWLAATAAGQVVVPASPAKEWVERAVEEAGRIEPREHRAEAWGMIAGAAAEAGDRELFHRLVMMALATAKETDAFTVGATMWAVAESQARAGDAEAALATASQAGLPVYVALAHAAAAQALAERDQIDPARTAIERGVDALKRLDQPGDVDWATLHLAQAMLAADDMAGARRLAGGCANATSRAEALACIALRLAELGDSQASAAALAEGREQLAAALHGSGERAVYADIAVVHLAEAQAAAGRMDDAEQALGQVSDPAAKAAGLIALARSAYAQRQPELARQWLDEARASNQAVAGAYERAGNWTAYTAARVRSVDAEAGEASLATWIEGLATPLERAFAYVGVAQGLIERGGDDAGAAN